MNKGAKRAGFGDLLKCCHVDLDRSVHAFLQINVPCTIYCNEEACTEEEAAEAKFEAQRLFAFIVFVSGVPSLWAQDELVWKKERQGKQVFGGKKSAKKGANKRR